MKGTKLAIAISMALTLTSTGPSIVAKDNAGIKDYKLADKAIHSVIKDEVNNFENFTIRLNTNKVSKEETRSTVKENTVIAEPVEAKETVSNPSPEIETLVVKEEAEEEKISRSEIDNENESSHKANSSTTEKEETGEEDKQLVTEDVSQAESSLSGQVVEVVEASHEDTEKSVSDENNIKVEPKETEEKVQEEANDISSEIELVPTPEPSLEPEEEAKAEDNSMTLSGYTIEALNVRERNSTSADVIGVLPAQTIVEGTTEDGWIKIIYNGELGYVAEDYVEVTLVAEENISADIIPEEVIVEESPIEEVPSSYDQVEEIAEEPVEVVDIVEVIEEVQEEVQEEVIESQPLALDSSSLINEAYNTIGSPYIFGGSSYSGFDCSGLTSYLYNKHYGIWIGRTTYEQINAGYEVSLADMQVGDLLCFSNSGGVCDHVGIYAGNGQYIHASTPERGVVADSTSGSYFTNNLISVRRIVD